MTISMRSLIVGVSLVCTLGASEWAAESAGRADKGVKLSGCLIRGEGDSGYLLINPPAEPSLNSPARY